MSTKLKDIVAERAETRLNAQLIYRHADSSGRHLDAHEQAHFDDLLGTMQSLEQQHHNAVQADRGTDDPYVAREITVADIMADRDAWENQSQGRVGPPSRLGPDHRGPDHNPRSNGPRLTGNDARTYAAMFGPRVSDDGWRSPEEFFISIHNGLSDHRQVMAANLGESLGSTGGFSVPTQFASRWLDSALEDEIIRPRAAVWPMTTSCAEASNRTVSPTTPLSICLNTKSPSSLPSVTKVEGTSIEAHSSIAFAS
ncbi:hypothetical protein LCGC14_2504680, partial [marine sediment metagenome]